MTRPFLPTCLALLAMTTALPAAQPLVFVSAFAAGDKAGIHAYHFDTATGSLTAAQRTTDIQMPFFLAVAPDKKHLFAIHAEKFGGPDDELVAAFAIEDAQGTLRRLNASSARGTASCYLTTDATGRTALVANYASGSVAALPIVADGSLGAAASFIQHIGSGLDPERQKGPNAHSIIVSPDNRFALAADLGIDQILIYQLDAAQAKLSANPAQASVKLQPGSGPRHLAFHPNGKQLYAINELANTITVFDYTASQGTLKQRQTIATLPADFTGKSYTADLKFTPDGRYLYGTNRGHDSIASYRVAEDGSLSLITIQPSQGKGPQNLLATPDGRWLLCANMPGNSVIVFAIDSTTGHLTPKGQPTELPMPSCLRWLE